MAQECFLKEFMKDLKTIKAFYNWLEYTINVTPSRSVETINKLEDVRSLFYSDMSKCPSACYHHNFIKGACGGNVSNHPGAEPGCRVYNSCKFVAWLYKAYVR